MLKSKDLKIEHLTNPIGIDETTPSFMWNLEGTSKSQSAYQIKVFNDECVYWDSGKVNSNKTYGHKYQGKDLKSRDILNAQVRVWDENDISSDWSSVSCFEIGLLNTKDWKATWINPEIETKSHKRNTACYVRKQFLVNSKILKARLYCSSLGIYEIYINGLKVGNQVLAPGSTSYHQCVQYQTYDITEMIGTGENVIGAVIGDGWFRGSSGMTSKLNIFGKNIAFIAQLEIITETGEIYIITDETWDATDEGPIRENDLKHGEYYDATKQFLNWLEPDYRENNKWYKPTLFNWPMHTLTSSNSVSIVEHEEFTAKTIETPNGDTLLDFGQNICGYVHFQITGNRGSVVELIHGETLDEYGNFTLDNIESIGKSPPIGQKVTYKLNGDEVESHKPVMSIFGFRYVKLKNWTEEIIPENFKAIAVYSDIKETGRFQCSNLKVNKLVQNTIWSQKSNYVDIPTDCPTRERAGYTGDAQVFTETGSYLMDIYGFKKKWLKEICINQREDGMVSNINPMQDEKFTMFDGSSGWGDAIVIIPYELYKKYGEKQILQENYNFMKNWVDFGIKSASKKRWFRKFLRNPYKDYLWDVDFHWGEWLEPNQTIKTMIYNKMCGVPEVSTAYLSYSSKLLSEIASILGYSNDSEKYLRVSNNAKQAYRYQFIKDGKINSKRQCLYVRPVALNLLDKKESIEVVENLSKLVKENNYHLNTGFLYTPHLCKVLSDYDQVETAYELLLQESCPGWLYAVNKGATTVWESWDGVSEDNKVKNSHNHYAYGAVVGWLFNSVSGIEVIPTNNTFNINPKPSRKLEWIECEYKSMIGEIKVKWQWFESGLELNITVPINTNAMLNIAGMTEELGPGYHEIWYKL